MIDWDDKEEEPLPPIEQLHAEAELLRMVEYWRLKYQDLRDSVWLTLRRK